MNRKSFENYMRGFESALDQKVPPEIPFVVRVDGRGFTQVIGSGDFNRPFDADITSVMQEAMNVVMRQSGFQIDFAYTQSDEISFLISRLDNTYNRKISKILSVIPSLVSSAVAETFNNYVSFDARISLLPSEAVVVDYFKWRRADAIRNSKNSFYYWTYLTYNMTDDVGAADAFSKLPDRAEIVESWGEPAYEDMPMENQFGSYGYWNQHLMEGFNPKTKMKTQAIRNRLMLLPAVSSDIFEATIRSKTT